MNIIISNSSQIPIYEQIISQIKSLIAQGELTTGQMLPSVRNMAKELKISALTVKKAYDALEQSGFVATVHGKGSFISGAGQGVLAEQARREVEVSMERTVSMGRKISMTDEDLMELLKLILED